MIKKERYKKVIAWFEKNNFGERSELHYSNPFELLIAVCLSAQCTDKRVNMVTPGLFHDFPTPEALASSSVEVLFEYIRSVSYPNNKAKNMLGMARKLLNDFGGEVPNDIDALQSLPGVGRKTANVVAAVAFNANAMPVDTHVFRVSNRLGLTTDSKTPLATEKELVSYIPAKLLGRAHHWILLHGRYVCTARNPKCASCGLTKYCLYFEKQCKKI